MIWWIILQMEETWVVSLILCMTHCNIICYNGCNSHTIRNANPFNNELACLSTDIWYYGWIERGRARERGRVILIEIIYMNYYTALPQQKDPSDIAHLCLLQLYCLHTAALYYFQLSEVIQLYVSWTQLEETQGSYVTWVLLAW